MKKLLITAIATAGMAFGLRAADAGYLAGTDFEDGNVPSTGWTIPDDDPNQSLVNTANTDAYSGNVPTQWTDSNHDKFLAVKTTFGKPISLDLATAQAMSDGAYFDSLVKMTVCDEAPAADTYAGAKIMVWAQENTDGTATSLWVRASAPDGSGWKSQDFQCAGKFDKADAWHRLTIKAIPDIFKAASAFDYVPGFVVYVDGEAIQCMGAQLTSSDLNDNAAKFNEFGQLFVSLDQTSENKTTISAVAFDGQGSLDDVTLTSAAPSFAKDYEFFTIDLGANVTGFNWAITEGESGSATASLQLPYAANMVVTISNVTCADGYMFKNLTADVSEMVDGNTFTVTAPNLHGMINAQAVGVTVGDQKFANLADAFEYLNTTATGDVVMELKAALASGELAEAITIDNANLTSVKIDLAGKTISCDEDAYVITTAVPLWITDSSEEKTGKIACTFEGESTSETGCGALYATAPVTIDAGIFDGDVLLGAEDQDKTISGGSFKDIWGTDPVAAYVADGYVSELLNGYYVVSLPPKKGWAIYLAAGEKENEFLIQDEGDLLDLATNINKTADFATEGITFKQTDNITLTEAFDGIGARDMKDTLGSSLENFTSANVFKGTFDGGNYTISGLILKQGDYVGFFNSCYGATIKNLKISLGNATGWSDTADDQVGAVFAGVTVNTTLENCQTIVAGDNNTFKATKTAAGLVGFAANGTVLKNCVNNLNIWSAANEKAAGLIACAQAGKSTGDGVVIENCSSYGNITAKDGTTRAVGLVCYADFAVTFKGDNIVGGTATIGPSGKSVIDVAKGSVTLEDGATFTVPAGYKTVTDGKAVDGLIYATVDGNVATLVKASALAADGTYKVMATGGAPVIVLKEGETIAFDQTLATIDATGITAESGCKIEATGLAPAPIVYTAVKAGGWNPDVEPTVKAGDVIKSGLPAALADVSFKQLSVWAQKYEVEFAAPESIIVDAFLFNCANTAEAVADEAAAFKFTAIEPGTTPTITDENLAGDKYNGTVTVKAFEDAACKNEVEPTGEETGLFYKATLTPTPVAE